ncbi:uncharacterized protein LOC116524691 [Sapajus apella]|uniref:Uncharacterized protein LOC116524691 n=1 Tax=Sapajus apella TaxID=9515 RepID=A0A6J3ETI3_SAPAP|nr:uncharacterized protein LOC116524691 [Sapajus apella]
MCRGQGFQGHAPWASGGPIDAQKAGPWERQWCYPMERQPEPPLANRRAPPRWAEVVRQLWGPLFGAGADRGGLVSAASESAFLLLSLVRCSGGIRLESPCGLQFRKGPASQGRVCGRGVSGPGVVAVRRCRRRGVSGTWRRPRFLLRKPGPRRPPVTPPPSRPRLARELGNGRRPQRCCGHRAPGGAGLGAGLGLEPEPRAAGVGGREWPSAASRPKDPSPSSHSDPLVLRETQVAFRFRSL